MLDMRPNCECCDKDISPESNEAYICSFECTFCKSCSEETLNMTCPNCSGELVKRPTRVGLALKNSPASTQRVVKKNGCGN